MGMKLQPDAFDHVVEPLIRLGSRHAQHAESLGREVFGLAAIRGLLVTCSVHLNDQSGRQTHEVREIRPDGKLATKLKAV